MFTSVLFHGSVLHLAFNMMAFVPMASSLERLLGTVQFAHILVLFTLLASIFHVGLAFIGGTLGYPSMHECAIGFSGVIFGVIVVDTHLSSVAQRSIFGFFTVPSQWYPLSLLIFLQVLMPSVSFVGHLSGLLAGLTYVRGHLNPLLLRPSTTAWIEQHAWAAPAVRHARSSREEPPPMRCRARGGRIRCRCTSSRLLAAATATAPGGGGRCPRSLVGRPRWRVRSRRWTRAPSGGGGGGGAGARRSGSGTH